MRKSAAIALPILLLIILALLCLRLQRSGGATVFRNGQFVVTKMTPLFVRSEGISCQASSLGGRVVFDDTFTGRSATLDEFSLHVRFHYSPPPRVPAAWSSGDWCSALRERVTQIVSRTSATGTFIDLLDRRRELSDRLASVTEAELKRDGLTMQDFSARIEVPQGIERARTFADAEAHARKSPPVIFVGLDGADWQLLDDYMARGTMPNMARIVADGTTGILETEYPPLSPLVWTTMMTGTGPLDHGILDFTRFNPQTHVKEPITSDERARPAIWNMLTAGGKSVAVLGLWATYAAEPVHGINVSDRLFTFLYSDTKRPPRTVFPDTREAWAARAVDAAEHGVNAARMRQYLPDLSDTDVDALARNTNPYADPPAALRRILVETEIYRSLGSDVLRGKIPDLSIIYFQGTDTIGHVFAPFSPPQQPSISNADYARYSSVPQRYFGEIDELLGVLIQAAERNGAILAVASDHGFFWREGRPTQVSSTATATAAKWHRHEGIYALWGAGIARSGGHQHRGGVRQICATLLSLTGMPAPSTGVKPLPGSPVPAPPIDYGRYFQRAASPPATTLGRGSEEEIAKLRALGYIGSGESPRPAVDSSDTRTAGSYNNAGLLLRDEHRTDDALRAFQQAMTIDPKYASAMWNASQTLLLVNGDMDRSDMLLVDAMRNGLADAPRLVITRVIEYQRSGRTGRSLPLLDAAVSAAPGDGELMMFRGGTRMNRHDCNGALADFRAAQPARPRDPLTYASAGLAQLCLGKQSEAQESFRRSLALDPNQPMIRELMH